MAIEVDIPMEIDDYQEKIIFGMSLRQLACFSSAVVLGVGTYFLCTKVVGMSMDAASYVIIIEALPLLALGFIRKDGQPFEKLFALFLRHQIGRKKLSYSVKVELQEEPEERKSNYAWIFEKNSTGNGKPVLSKQERNAESHIREAVIFRTEEKSRKRKSKETRAKIKAAQKEYRAAKRRDKEESKIRSRAEKLG